LWVGEKPRIALATHRIGDVFGLLQRWGLSQRRIAARSGLHVSEVTEILAGRRVHSYEVLVRIADGLDIPRGLMGLASHSDPAQAPCDRCPARQVVPRWSAATVLALRRTLRLSQRDFAKHLGTAARTVHTWEHGTVPQAASQSLLDTCVHLLPEPIRVRFVAAAIALTATSPAAAPRRCGPVAGVGERGGVDSTRSVAHANLTADT
jgi:transcriptional regulator with XRE-family HTH domain